MFGDQLLSNRIKLCVYIYVLINFWLCYVIKFTWMIQQRWKTFDATVRRGFCPFLTLKKKNSWAWIDSLTSAMGRRSLINLSKSTKPLSEREREKTCSLFVCLIFWKLDWGHHTINEPAVGKYKVGWVVSSSYSFEAVGNFSRWWGNLKLNDRTIDQIHKFLSLVIVKWFNQIIFVVANLEVHRKLTFFFKWALDCWGLRQLQKHSCFKLVGYKFFSNQPHFKLN